MSAQRKPKVYVRWLCAALILALCIGFSSVSCADDGILRGYDPQEGYLYLNLGVYPQTLEGGLEPILWRILSVKEGVMLMVSEYVLFNHRIHYDDVEYIRSGGDFAETEMFADLNGAFLAHFTQDEKAMMIPGDDGGLITLLTRDDLKNKAYGFTGDTARRGYPTAYALQNGLFQYSNGSSPYWTRTQSSSYDYGTVCTKESGNLGYIRVVVQNEGARPAVSLDLSMLTVQSGSGWFYDPFCVALNQGGK